MSKEIKELEDLTQARAESWYTIIGCGGDLYEWVEGYEKAMSAAEIGTPVQWYRTTGHAVNELTQGEGFDRFPADLTMLLFPLDGLNAGSLALFKLAMGDRWFDDICDNIERRRGSF